MNSFLFQFSYMIADLKFSVLVGVSDFLGQQVRGSKVQRVGLVPALVD